MNAAVGDKLTLSSWWRDHLPNHLWACWHLSAGDFEDLERVAHLLDVILDAIGEQVTDSEHLSAFAGRMTDFESLSADTRASVLGRLFELGLYEEAVPIELATTLVMYPTLPGRWLIEPRLQDGTDTESESAERRLASVVTSSFDGQGDVASRVKALVFRQSLKSGKLHFDLEGPTRLAIEGYPDRNDPGLNRLAESTFRAMFQVLEPEGSDWAAAFWRANWSLYSCNEQVDERRPDVVDADSEEALATRAQLRSRSEQLWRGFLDTAARADPDLYVPDRHEVLTGIVGRSLRLVRTITGYPPMWTMEHGAPVLRAVVEARIALAWMEQSQKKDVYKLFKDYGIGRMKLYKLHLEELVDEAGDAPDGLSEYIEMLNAFVNRDSWEVFRDVNLGGNAFGEDMRRMAEKTGFISDYRLLFAPASSAVHGEWGAIEMNVMSICGNPLHAGHRIIRSRDETVIGPAFLSNLQDYAEALIGEYATAMAKGSS